MLVPARSVRLVIEAAERHGIPSSRILESVGVEAAWFDDEIHRLEWSRFVQVCQALSEATGHDRTALRAIGASTNVAPSFTPL